MNEDATVNSGCVLEVRNATKSFPGVKALDDVTIEIRKNEVVGLIGENGAGKSTLLKILNGVYQPEAGEIRINGQAARVKGPRDAFDLGIAMVFQEQSILPVLTVAENIFLGRENEFLRFGVLDKRAMNEAAKEELRKVHLDISPTTLCDDLTFAERQMVEIAKAISLDTRIDGDIVILLDEPTSVLESKEIEVLFRLVDELKERAAFVFISHRIDEVLRISDRVYVLRDGKVVSEEKATDVSVHRLHELMVGRALQHEYYREARQGEPSGEAAMEVVDLSSRAGFRNVSFKLHTGEILGIAGVIGSGREALAQCLAGLAPINSGKLVIGGKARRFGNPSQAVAAGIGYLPRERRTEGVVTGAPVSENMTMPALEQFSRFGMVQRRLEFNVVSNWIDKLKIKTPSPDTLAGSLSGGNQQKVVLSKWRIAGSKIVVLDHPTRGIDVGAKEDVYELIRDMTDDGLSIVLLADTLEEVIGLSHTILVMRDGAESARFDAPPGGKPSQIDLIEHMV